MIQFLIFIAGLAILAAIFLRRYFVVEKGIGIRSFLAPRNKVVRHFYNPHSIDVTAEEMIPSKENMDPKKVARAGILLKKAEVSLNRGDAKGAEKALIQAISLDPSLIEAYNKLGLIYLRHGQFGKAESMYRKLILSVATEPAYFSNLGMALYSQHKLEEAKTNYKKAIELDNTRAGRFFSLGQIFQELGEFEEALENFQQAVARDPDNLNYLLMLAHFYIDRGMQADARQLLTDILAAYPDHEEANNMMEKVK